MGTNYSGIDILTSEQIEKVKVAMNTVYIHDGSPCVNSLPRACYKCAFACYQHAFQGPFEGKFREVRHKKCTNQCMINVLCSGPGSMISISEKDAVIKAKAIAALVAFRNRGNVKYNNLAGDAKVTVAPTVSNDVHIKYVEKPTNPTLQQLLNQLGPNNDKVMSWVDRENAEHRAKENMSKSGIGGYSGSGNGGSFGFGSGFQHDGSGKSSHNGSDAGGRSSESWGNSSRGESMLCTDRSGGVQICIRLK